MLYIDKGWIVPNNVHNNYYEVLNQSIPPVSFPFPFPLPFPFVLFAFPKNMRYS